MKTYLVFENPEYKNDPYNVKFVEDGFSFMAAIFQTLWALFYKMWFLAVMLFIIALFFGFLDDGSYVDKTLLAIFNIFIFLFVGFNARDWYMSSLRSSGYELKAVLKVNNLEEAKFRFFKESYSGSALDKMIKNI